MRATKNYAVAYDYWPTGPLAGKKRFLAAHKEFESGRLQLIVEPKNKKSAPRHVVLLSYQSLVDAFRAGVLRGDALRDAKALLQRLGTTRGEAAGRIWQEEFLGEVNEQIQPGSTSGEGSSGRPVPPGSGAGNESGGQQDSLAEVVAPGPAQTEGGPDSVGDKGQKDSAVVGSGQEEGQDDGGGESGPARLFSEVWNQVFTGEEGKGEDSV